MPGLSDYSELKTLDFLFGSTQPATPGTWYLGLLITAGAETDIDPTAKEPTYGGYARLAIPNNTTRWSAAASGTKANAGSLFFGTVTSGSGTLIGWCLCDALTLGTVWVYGTLTTNKIVSTGDVPQLATSDLQIMID